VAFRGTYHAPAVKQFLLPSAAVPQPALQRPLSVSALRPLRLPVPCPARSHGAARSAGPLQSADVCLSVCLSVCRYLRPIGQPTFLLWFILFILPLLVFGLFFPFCCPSVSVSVNPKFELRHVVQSRNSGASLRHEVLTWPRSQLSLLRVQDLRVEVSARRRATLIEGLRGFLQSLKANTGVMF
jgi:hypothetical protein